jgi:hypothetical protein
MTFDQVRHKCASLWLASIALAGGAALTLGLAAAPAEAKSISFYTLVPSDVVSVTQSGVLSSLNRVPKTIDLLTDPALKSGVAFLHKIRDASGNVVGFATQLEDIKLEDGKFSGLTDTAWTVMIHGRGSLFLFETEDSRKLSVLVSKIPKTDVPIQLEGPVVTTTSGPAKGGRGIIIGGTGEFAGAKGTFVEINKFTGINPANQSVSPFIFEIEVKVDFDL